MLWRTPGASSSRGNTIVLSGENGRFIDAAHFWLRLSVGLIGVLGVVITGWAVVVWSGIDRNRAAIIDLERRQARSAVIVEGIVLGLRDHQGLPAHPALAPEVARLRSELDELRARSRTLRK